ncbi:MFS transporter prlL like protein [Verticillium longisporum]|nr:MFS transporter prlL like protein [Verticillium longisporum]
MVDWKAWWSPAPSLDIPGLETVDLADKAMERRIVRKQDLHILPWVCVSYLLSIQHCHAAQPHRPALQCRCRPLLRALRPHGVPLQHPPQVLLALALDLPHHGLLGHHHHLHRCRLHLRRPHHRPHLPGSRRGRFLPRYHDVPLLLVQARRARHAHGHLRVLCRRRRGLGGLLATAISFLNNKGGLNGWQWLFILEGIPSVIVGVLIWFYLPDYPQTAAWLTPEERAFAVKRLGPYAPSMNDKHWDSAVAKETLSNPMFWLFASQYFLIANSLNAFGYFAPTIVASLGFSGHNAQLLTVPPNIVAMIVIISNCLHSDRTRERSRHVIGALVFVGAGYLLLAVVRHWGVRYFAVCIIACTNAAVLPFVAHRTATVSGSTATALATGGMIAISNCGGISAPFLFPKVDGPMYSMGNWTIFAFLIVAACMTCFTWYMYGSHAGYRTGARDENGNLEVLDATSGDPDEVMNKAMGLEKKKDLQQDV